jgi:polyphosphate glucokinase
VISPRGKYLVKRVRIKTPKRRKPRQIVEALTDLAAPLGRFDHVTIGFPGMIRNGKVMTAPAFGTKDWKGFGLAAAMQKKFGKPVKLLNDADVQGLAGVGAGGSRGQSAVSGWPEAAMTWRICDAEGRFRWYVGDKAVRRNRR